MKSKIFRVLIFLAALGPIAIKFWQPLAPKRVYAQSGCTQEAPPWDRAFPPGTTVYYTMDVSLLPQGPDNTKNPTAQVTNALKAWSTADTGPGGNGTTFLPADASHPATLTITWDTEDTNGSATTSIPSSGAAGINNPATITFHPESTIPETGELAFQPDQPGYDTAYQQSALHEIAHVLGFDDYNRPPANVPEPPPGTSVLNSFFGVNDTGTNPPLLVPKPCDVTTASTYSAAASASGGGGTDPGSGTLDPPTDPPPVTVPTCYTWEEWDPETNTLTEYSVCY